MSLDPKDPDVPATYSINWRRRLIGPALRETEFVLAAVVRPERTTGFYYSCTTAGLTAESYPESWPTIAGQEVRDGSAVWTAVHPDDASVPSVQSAVWTVPTGITKDSQSESGTHTHITLSGGTDGVDYDLTCRMTPTSGNAIDQTITVPVRSL